MKNKYFLLLEWEVSYLELEFNDVKNITYLRENEVPFASTLIESPFLIHLTSIYHSWMVNIV